MNNRDLLPVAIAVLVAGLLWLLAPVLTPFAAAALLAYLGDPMVDRLEARGLPRTLGVVVVFLLLAIAVLAAVMVVLPLAGEQLWQLLERLPGWVEQAQGRFPVLAELDLTRLVELAREHWRAAGGWAQTVLASASSSGLALLAWLANGLLIPVLTFYLLRDWDNLIARLRELLPRPWEPTIVDLSRDADEALGAFLRGQLSVMLALAAVYAAGLWMLGINAPVLIGLLAGVVSFIPYLGLVVGIAVAGVVAWFQFQELWVLLGVAAVFGLAQVLETALFTPWFVGDRIGLHPVAVIFAVLAGGQLFGFVGTLLALPAAAVIAVLLRHAHRRYLDSETYAGQ
ncbi:MAG: AI-2E family transporter [Thiohalospira sp.]|uniref:AI-2E family transporter n=1 Tax=Thiohalospira sp. TaxID=3080549 RepID=UPI00397F9805